MRVARLVCAVGVLMLAATVAPEVASANGVVGWGQPYSNNFGTGGGLPHEEIAVAASGLSGVRSVAVGGRFTLALKEDGTVVGWGSNREGALGKTSSEWVTVETPTAVPVLSTVKQVAAGENFGLALLENGTVMAWGSNVSGQLGDGAKEESRGEPQLVSGLSKVRSIAAGGEHALAALEDGSVMTWGGGSGTTYEHRLTTPAPIGGLSGVRSVVAAPEVSFAVLEDGTVKSWGFNSAGDLGTGVEKPEERPPAEVKNLTGVTQLAAGGDHGVALLEDGTVKVWGINFDGELGLGTEGGSHSEPAAIPAISGAKGVAAGPNVTDVLLADGTVVAAGGGPIDGVHAQSSTPIPVCGVHEATAVAAGGNPAQAGERAAFAVGATGPLCEATERTERTWGPPGETVNISGANFQEATEVHFGGAAASFKVLSPRRIQAVAPAGSGTVAITVSSPTSTSAVHPFGDHFTYLEPPSFGHCTAVTGLADALGSFTDSGCTVAKTTETAPYEWRPVTTGAFATSSSTVGTFETAAGAKITCSGETGTGEYSGTKSLSGVVLSFTGCERLGAKCTSSALPEGTIRTTALDGVLGLAKLGKGGKPVENTPGIQLAAAPPGAAFASFSCGGTEISLRGSVLATAAGNRNLAPKNFATLGFAAAKGKQKPEKLIGATADPLEVSVGGGPFGAIGFSGKMKVPYIEFNTVA